MAQSIFSTQIPSNFTDQSSPGGLTLNTLFTVTVPGVITHIRRYRSITAPTFASVSLYSSIDDSTGTLLSTGSTWTGGGVGGSGWDTCALAAPISVVPGQYYYAGYTTDRFVSDTTASVFKVDAVRNGNLIAPMDDAVTPRRNGRFSNHNGGSPAYPTQGLGNNYFVDVVFVPDVVGQSIFTTQVPTGHNFFDGQPIITGTKFRPLVSGYILQHRFWAPSTVSAGQTYTGLLWTIGADQTTSGTLLGDTGPTLGIVADQWNIIPYSSPIPVTAGQIYQTVTYSSSGRYVATSSFFGAAALINGNLEGRKDATLGQANGSYDYWTGGAKYPKSFFSAASYFADVVFKPTQTNTGAFFPFLVAA